METNRSIILHPTESIKTLKDTGRKPGARAYISEKHEYELARPDVSKTGSLHVKEAQLSNERVHAVVRGKAAVLNKFFSEMHSKVFNQKRSLSESQINADMDKFYNCMVLKVIKDSHVTSGNFAMEFSGRDFSSREDALSKFMSLSTKRKASVVNSYQAYLNDKYGKGDFSDLIHLTLTELDKEEPGSDFHGRLFGHVMSNLGEKDTWLEFPRSMVQECKEYLEASIDKRLLRLEKNGIEFVGHGDVGYVFKVEIEGQRFALKAPIYKPGSALGSTLPFQEGQFDKFQEEFKGHPAADFLPENLKDSNGEKLGIPGKVLVMKLFDGDPILTSTLDPESGSSIRQINSDYQRMGLDDQFLVDFMDFYLVSAKKGFDLHDIRLGNLLYKGRSLQFPDLGGNDDPLLMDAIEERKKMPEAHLLYEMMDSILMFATNGPNGIPVNEQIFYSKPENQEKDDLGYYKLKTSQIKPMIQEMTGHRYGQLVRAFEMAVKQGIMTSKEVLQGVKDLKNLSENFNVYGMSPNRDNERYNYKDGDFLDNLEDHFKKQTGLKAFVGSVKTNARNSYLNLKSKIGF